MRLSSEARFVVPASRKRKMCHQVGAARAFSWMLGIWIALMSSFSASTLDGWWPGVGSMSLFFFTLGYILMGLIPQNTLPDCASHLIHVLDKETLRRHLLALHFTTPHNHVSDLPTDLTSLGKKARRWLFKFGQMVGHAAHAWPMCARHAQ